MEEEDGKGVVVIKDSLIWNGCFVGFGFIKVGDGVEWWMFVVDYDLFVVNIYIIDEMGVSLYYVDILLLFNYFFFFVEECNFSYLGFFFDGI